MEPLCIIGFRKIMHLYLYISIDLISKWYAVYIYILFELLLFHRWVHDYQDACVDKLEKFIMAKMTSPSATKAYFLNPLQQITSGLKTIGQHLHEGQLRQDNGGGNEVFAS